MIATAIDPHSGSRTDLADRTIFDEVLDEDMARAIYADNMRKMNAAAPVFYRNGEIVEIAPKKRESNSKVEDNTNDESTTDSRSDDTVDQIGETMADDANSNSKYLKQAAPDDEVDATNEAAIDKNDDEDEDDQEKKDENKKKSKKKKAAPQKIPMGLVLAAGGITFVLFIVIFLFVFKRGKKRKEAMPSEETIIENQPTKDVQKGSSRLEKALSSMSKDKGKGEIIGIDVNGNPVGPDSVLPVQNKTQIDGELGPDSVLPVKKDQASNESAETEEEVEKEAEETVEEDTEVAEETEAEETNETEVTEDTEEEITESDEEEGEEEAEEEGEEDEEENEEEGEEDEEENEEEGEDEGAEEVVEEEEETTDEATLSGEAPGFTEEPLPGEEAEPKAES